MTRWMVLGLVGLMGCAGEKDAPVEEEGLTYYKDVQPIYAQRCFSCHQEGGIAPFGLDTPEDAAAWAEASLDAMTDRRMPPWLVKDDGTCGEYVDSQWMSEDEIAVVQAWLDAGAEAGDPADAASTPEPTRLERADWVLSTPVDYEPQIEGGLFAEYDDYRCFLIENDSGKDRYITGYDVVPGNEAIVHHVLAMPVEIDGRSYGSRTNREEIEYQDGLDDRDGWPCFGLAGGSVRDKGVPVAWAPGQGAVLFPEGTGLRVGPGDAMVIQLHYNLADPANIGSTDTTVVNLQMEDEVEFPGWNVLEDKFLDDLLSAEIPPGESAYQYSFRINTETILNWGGRSRSDTTGAMIRAVMPHMHERGQQMFLTKIHADGSEECIMDVPRWDFNWQRVYFYTEPIPMYDGDKLKVTCEWNTEGESDPVSPGWGTRNEMCLPTLFATAIE